MKLDIIKWKEKSEKKEKDRYQKQTQIDHVTDGNEAGIGRMA
jgi:hypothetical protein